jgi:hypothetical protein
VIYVCVYIWFYILYYRAVAFEFWSLEFGHQDLGQILGPPLDPTIMRHADFFPIQDSFMILPLLLPFYVFISSLFEIESAVYTHFRRCMLSGERLLINN